MKIDIELTAIIKKGEKQFVALCPEIDVVSQGKTIEQALKNLKEAVELYREFLNSEIKKINHEKFTNIQYLN